MKKYRIPALLLAVAMLCAMLTIPAAAVDDPEIDCYSAVLLAVDGDNATTLYTKNENDRVYPASLTKVMTVLLAVEAIEEGTVSLSDPVTAQSDFSFDLIDGGTSVYITAGETMTLENLLYCAMIASANDACNVIAEYIGGTIADFVTMMNARAMELGCDNTRFTNTHGLPDENHYTTAWDFSLILREAINHELFMTICNTVNYTVPATNAAGERSLSSTNSLINPNNPLYPGDYLYEYARGIKTGHTSDAGYCLASSAQKDDIQLVSVVFNGQAYAIDDSNWYYAHFADTITLFDWAFDNFSYQEIVKSTEIVDEVPVTMGQDADSVAVRPANSITALLPNDVDPDSFERSVILNADEDGNVSLQAPVSAGQVVGTITVSKDGVVYGSADLITSTSVELSRSQYMGSQVSETLHKPIVVIIFWGLILLFAAYLVLVFRYRAKRRAYQKRLANARQLRLDMEEEEDEVRYVPRPKKTAPASAAPRKQVVTMDPETKKDVPTDEPTRNLNTGDLPPVDDEPTKAGPPIITEEDENDVKTRMDEFFRKK